MVEYEFKWHILTFFSVTFLFISTYSFIVVDWRTEQLNNIKFFIGSLEMLMIIQIFGSIIGIIVGSITTFLLETNDFLGEVRESFSHLVELL
jgi:hypothetical protein